MQIKGKITLTFIERNKETGGMRGITNTQETILLDGKNLPFVKECLDAIVDEMVDVIYAKILENG